MRATWRPLPAWPYQPARRLEGSRLRAPWETALARLEDEIERLGGDARDLADVQAFRRTQSLVGAAR